MTRKTAIDGAAQTRHATWAKATGSNHVSRYAAGRLFTSENMRLKILCAAAVLLLMLPSGFAASEKAVTVGIPSAQFNFVSAVQLRTEWCWAASVQMVLNWYDIPVRQTDVVNRVYHKTVDAAASENEITVALSGTAYDRTGHKVSLHAVRHHGTPPAELLIAELGHRRPMLMTLHSSRTMLHAVVVTSVEYIDSSQGVRITAMTLRDPNPTFHDRRTAGAVRVSGRELTQFVHAISSYYLVSVKS